MPFDVVIRGGHLVDGTGSAARLADVGIRNGKIARVGRVGRAESAMAIEASGKYVAPGFIDIHTHSDIGILVEPTAECAVRQGVTTHVIGNCGDSPAPISEEYRELAVRRFEYYAQAQDWSWSTYGEYLDFMAAQGVGINIAGLVGHGSVRLATMGFEERPPTPDERVKMKAFVDEAMRAGAFGMSTGLVYPPGCFAATEEIVELAQVVARHHGFYASHIRGERETVVDAVRECIEIGERAGCAVQISHNNPKYGGIGKGKEIQALWEAAKDRGVDPWTTYFDTIVEERDRAVGLFDYMDPEEVKSTLRHPLVMICSDGWVAPKEERTSPTAPYQPCTYGEFPGVIERYVVKEHVLRLEEAIHKMTGLPASRLGLGDRGLLRAGSWADLVVFDLPRVRDRATNPWPHTYPFENYPHEYPEGTDWVLVTGAIALEDGRPTGPLAGHVVRHKEGT